MRRELLAVSRDYPQPADELWPVVADLDGYARHVTGLESTPLISGDGLGAIRECNTTTSQNWSERVSVWEPRRRYEIEVDTATYPTPLRQLFRRFTGIWEIEPVGDGCRVWIRFVPDVRGGWLVWPIVVLGARQSRRDLDFTLQSYADALG